VEKGLQTQADQSSFRGYLLFFGGQQISLLGSSVAQFVVIWWITIETESAWYLALASIAGFAPMILLTPFAGVMVDRWSRKVLIGVMDLLQALSTVLLISLFWTGIVSIAYVLVLLAFRSCCQAFHAPAVEAIVPIMVPREKLSRINGLNYLLTGVMTLVGPVAAALLLVLWRIDQVLWIDPATFMIALTSLLLIKIPSVRGKHETSSFKEDFKEGFGFIRKSRGLLPLIFMATTLNFLLMPLSTLLPYFVSYDHHGGAIDFGFVTAATQFGILAGGGFMMLKQFKRKMLTSMVFILTYFLGYVLVSLTPFGLFWFMGVSLFVMTFGVAPANVLFRTIIQTIVPAQMQGRVNSVLMSLSSAASPFGMMLSGIIAEFTGTANLFLACATIGTIVLLFAWFLTDMKHVENIQENSYTSANESSNLSAHTGAS
jgi:DHA3 family macrolide efflux protein-like MFS transporter